MSGEPRDRVVVALVGSGMSSASCAEILRRAARPRLRFEGGFVESITIPPCRTVADVAREVFAAEIKVTALPPLPRRRRNVRPGR